jgi:hypothetical protein
MVAVTAARPPTCCCGAARTVFGVKSELDVVHIIVGGTNPPADGRPIDGLRQLAADHGARWHGLLSALPGSTR